MLVEWSHTGAGQIPPQIYYYSLVVVACDGETLPGRWARTGEPHKNGLFKKFPMCDVRALQNLRCFPFNPHSIWGPCWSLSCYLDNTWRIFAHKLFSYKSMFGEHFHLFASTTSAESESAASFPLYRLPIFRSDCELQRICRCFHAHHRRPQNGNDSTSFTVKLSIASALQ